MGYGSWVKFVYKGHRIKVKVAGAKKGENPYSRNVKLRSAITAVLKHISREVCMQHWFLANVISLYVVVCPSVVCRLKRSCALQRRLKFSAMFLCRLIPWLSVTFR